MKKIIFAALLCFLVSIESNAQVTFNPGVRGGINFSHLTKRSDYVSYSNGYYTEEDNNPYPAKTDFYLGVYGALRLTKYYTLQPEIDYMRQGAQIKSSNSNIDVSYLSFIVINKFSFNEKFNIHVGPTLDFVVEKNFDVDSEVDLAFIAGAGFNVTKNFCIEARVKKGIIPVIDLSSNNHTNVVFSIGAAYTFDTK